MHISYMDYEKGDQRMNSISTMSVEDNQIFPAVGFSMGKSTFREAPAERQFARAVA